MLIDPELYKIFQYVINPLNPKANLILGFKIMDEHAEDQIDKINKDKITNLVFILKPTKLVLERAIRWKHMFEKGTSIDSYFLYVPRRTCECDELMVNFGLMIKDRVSYINMAIVPLESDLLSLEIYDSFYQTQA